LIVANHGVTVIRILTRAAEAFEYGVGRDWTIKDFARGSEPLSFLGENRHSRIDDLEDVIFSDGERVI
jgi:hypothetical protein